MDWFIASATPGLAVCFKCGRDFQPEEGYEPLAGCHGVCLDCAGGGTETARAFADAPGERLKSSDSRLNPPERGAT